MDTDVGAYGLEGILNLVEKNRLEEGDDDDDDDSDRFERQTIEDSLARGNRCISQFVATAGSSDK
jgi:hypothetical protein